MTRMVFGRLAGTVALTLAVALSPAVALDTGGGGASGGGGGGTQMSTSRSAGAHTAAPTLAVARADIKAQNWAKAIADLKLIVAANPGSADAYNLLGYAYRNAGNTQRAGQAYARALKLDPRHTGALEYQGILFVKLGQTSKAQANLEKIKTLCGTSCEEYKDLAKAIG